MNKLLTATSMIALMAVSANAADLQRRAVSPLAPVPVSDWTGAYIGIHAGVAGMNQTNRWVSNTYSLTDDYRTPDSDLLPDNTGVSGNAYGALFGGHIGYNYQLSNSFVVGAEAAFSSAKLSKAFSPRSVECADNACTLSPVGTFESSANSILTVNSVASIRGKLGLAFGNVMPYLAAGVGFVNAQFQAETTGGEQGRISIAKFAPVIGAGLEWKATRNISFKFDVSHYMINFKSDTWGLGGGQEYSPGYTFNNDIALKSLTVGRIGMSYHW